MKTAGIICNVILFAFICLVVATDGPSKEAVYIVFTLWWLLTPILSAAVISRMKAGDGRLDLLIQGKTAEGTQKADGLSMRAKMRITAIACNILFIGFVCWAFVDQYPHPNEEGFIPFLVMMALVPIISIVALFRGRSYA
jgi:hypothetical protein